jgi:hypothetical protein
VISFTSRPLYPQGKNPWYPLDRILGGPQSRSGRGGEEKNSSPRRESNPRTPSVNCYSTVSKKIVVSLLNCVLRLLFLREFQRDCSVEEFILEAEYTGHVLLFGVLFTETVSGGIFRFIPIISLFFIFIINIKYHELTSWSKALLEKLIVA